MMDPNLTELKHAVYEWEQGENRFNQGYKLSPEHIRTESVLIHDAVNLYAAAVRKLSTTVEIEIAPTSCSKHSRWKHGHEIVRFMKRVSKAHETRFITGPMIFDENGRRNHFVLEIIELSHFGFKKIGTWDNIHSVTYTRTFNETMEQTVQSLQNKIFKVASRTGPPFLMIRYVASL